jgi:hypothetical protein
MGVQLGGFADPQILTAPKSGSATISGYRILYTPKKNFSGSDRFTYARINVDRWGNRNLRTVNMIVDVIPNDN